MSRAPTAPNSDLQRLVEEGYSVRVADGQLVLDDLPYVNEHRCVRNGTLVVSLRLAGDVVCPPDAHWVHWAGDSPRDHAGRPLAIGDTARPVDHGRGLTTDRMLCHKPPGREFRDYHELVVSYATLLVGHARRIDPSATPRTRRPLCQTAAEESPFVYADTASARAGIGGLSARLAGGSVGIVGLGGTGSYVLDLVAKTPSMVIHLFDDDLFLQHNAFRAPGATSSDAISARMAKVDHYAAVYSTMHRGIFAHRVRLGPGRLKPLDRCDFVFLCMDESGCRAPIITYLERTGKSFIDVGMGLLATENGIRGSLRVTTSTPARRDHVRDGGRVPLAADEGGRDFYATNIQVADLNALNAALAVIRWKRLRGFYADLEAEHHAVFDVAGNALLNADRGSDC